MVVFVTAVVSAHEFWLQPRKFYYSIREVANIRFLVGENFTGSNWTDNRDKVAQLVHYTPSGAINDLTARLSANKGDSLQLPLQEEGTHMVIFNSTHSFIGLEAGKFNEYLLEDGLDPVTAYRKLHHEDTLNGREHYQRSVKTIFQVGGRLTEECINPTSLPLDIIPLENPYAIPQFGGKDQSLQVKFRVLFNGAPRENLLVKIWYHTAQKQVKMDTLRTNKKGIVTTTRHPGACMVSCVYMERAAAATGADWQSYWSSLTFEYSQFFSKARSRP
ncbi:MAG: hypothetical protein JWQ78_486 [Sediminibacterium sp.]|nr:hypothetical protein [Sediminibacterium sp.]